MKAARAIGPTMTFPRNIIDFTQPHEPAAIKGRDPRHAAGIRDCLRQSAQGEAGRCADDDRNRFGLRSHALRRMARDRAGDLRAGPWVFTRRRHFAARHRLPARLHGERRQVRRAASLGGSPTSSRWKARRSRTSPILQDKQRIRHVHIAGKRMQIPARWLRSAPGDRSKLEQLDRSLYAGAGQVAAAEPGTACGSSRVDTVNPSRRDCRDSVCRRK